MYEQREIILIPFPYSDLTGSKKRPALIISNKKLNLSEDRICCLITSNPTNLGVSIENKDIENGKLPLKSWIKPYRIFTINEKIIVKRICKINEKFYDKVLSNVNNYLKLD